MSDPQNEISFKEKIKTKKKIFTRVPEIIMRRCPFINQIIS